MWELNLFAWDISFILLNSKFLQFIFYLLAVLTIFNHEIPPFSNYSIHTKILTWDQKWLFLVSYFRLDKSNKITSLGLSRCIFKESNGKTIKPEEIFEAGEYLKDESEEEKEKRENIRQKEMKFVEGICSTERLLDEDKIL